MSDKEMDTIATAIVAWLISQGTYVTIAFRVVGLFWPNDLYIIGVAMMLLGFVGVVAKFGGFND